MTEKTWNEQLKEWLLKRLSEQELGRGARIKIRRDSRFADQNYGEGVVIGNFGDHSIDGEPSASVKFDDRMEGKHYRMSDLGLVDQISEEQLRARRLNKKDLTTAAEMLGIPESDAKSYLTGKIVELSQVPREQRKALYKVTGLGLLRPEFEIPKFEGRDLDINGQKHKVNLLRGEFGKEVLEEYQERVKSEYNGIGTLNVLSFYDGVVRGSNSFAVVLVNQIISSGGFRTATLADLERILEQGTLDLSSTYNDGALILRTQCEVNAKLAQHLAKQIKARDGKIEYPVMVPLTSLELDNPSSDASKSSDYGLAFNLREDGKIYHAPQLVKSNHEQRFSRGDENGLPILGSGGNRTLCTMQFGLARAFLNSNRNLNSHYDCLRNSYEHGQVVVVSAEGTRENF
ncbi:MAG: hypothetical protein QW727_01700 [Candidatus Pacearchaeota archaeon]